MSSVDPALLDIWNRRMALPKELVEWQEQLIHDEEMKELRELNINEWVARTIEQDH